MKACVKLLLLLALPLAWFISYALSPFEIEYGGLTLESPDLSSFLDSPLCRKLFAHEDQHLPLDSAQIFATTVAQPTAQSEEHCPLNIAPKPDSTKFRILFFGDSMLERLAPRFCDYTMENQCDLTGVIWYSSTTELWAKSDTLEHFMAISNPDLVLVCLGSNELFVKDLPKREKYIATILKKIAGRPFVWISPPNWREDTGINDLIIDQVGRDHYFDSRTLILERSSDKAHPTFAAASYWMDTIVSWMRGPRVANPLPLKNPTHKYRHKYHQYLLQPVK